MEKPLFKNRHDAGHQLAEKLRHYQKQDDVFVLALPRGGVPVGYQLSQTLDLPLDILVVRKLGLPGHEEFAMGAVASGGVEFLNQQIIDILSIKPAVIEKIRDEQLFELKRRQQNYRGSRPWPNLQNKTVILVDDGLATGATMRVAIESARRLGVKKLVVAVPLAPADSLRMISMLTDETICLATPDPFIAVGKWYETFDQTRDEEVRKFLQRSWKHLH